MGAIKLILVNTGSGQAGRAINRWRVRKDNLQAEKELGQSSKKKNFNREGSQDPRIQSEDRHQDWAAENVQVDL